MTSNAMGIERWRGKVALVTGATSGIGRAIARKLRKAGLSVAAVGRRGERLSALMLELGAEDNLPVVADLRDEAELLRCFRQVSERFGGVDVLVNNAGLGYEASLLEGETRAWREMWELNVLALSAATRLAISDMRRRSVEGHVFHMSSLSAHRVTPGGGGFYAATKAAVRSLTESLRLELHRAGAPIRVTAISPGFVQTEFHAGFFASEERAHELYDSHRMLDPDDIADAVLYALGSPAHVQVHDVLLRSREQAT